MYGGRMFELQRLRLDHEAAVLDFERANRAYFAESITDRGDDFFATFADQFQELLAEQEEGVGMFHVLVDDDGTVVGRFNLYRVARRVSGRGVATSGVQELCRIARDEYGLQTLNAATSNANIASQRVLTKAGFVAIGPADVAGRKGTRYELTLASD
jgi:[ribosomal protein S5]-alanine N-acetyltransferase